MTKQRYELAKEVYNEIGINVENAVKELLNIPISIHCWQGDDVAGFEDATALTGGIQATGNYMGKARNPQELMADIDKVLELVPGKHRINLHANYAIFENGEFADRNKLEPKHFSKWVEFAKARGLGLDFNPTFFSHAKASEGTLSSENEEVRKFWVEHGQQSLKITEYFARELGTPSTMNIWIGDGFKDIPADRKAPRERLKKSLDEILAVGYDKALVNVAVESKVFGIGVESYTVGSHEFYMNYAAKNDILCLLDNGHFHPTEQVADKISSMLLFAPKVALHVTRPVRWDSDHVVLYNDEIKEIAKEIIINGHENVIIGLDYFDASINRISAWVVGIRNMQKALLGALLTPHDKLSELQKARQLSELMVVQEEVKMLPVGDVWNFVCEQNNVLKDGKWFDEIKKYETEVLSKRV